MKQVFVDQDLARVGLYKSVLDGEGIPNFIRNELRNWSDNNPTPPTLCVINDGDFDRAMEILGAIYYAPPSAEANWRCPKCSQEVPSNFDVCWNCGTSGIDSRSTFN